MEMTCPKCQGAMRSYERNGVHVDQCTECRGIFLDRGELERLIDAESDWHAGTRGDPGAQPASSGQPTPGSGGLGALVGEVLQQAKAHKQGSYGHGEGYAQPRRKKKDSFLGELFG